MWQQVYERHRDNGLEVIAIACDVQGVSAAKPWIEKSGATFTTLIDTDNTLAAMFGFNVVPLAIWLDKEGKVVRGPVGVDIRKENQQERLAAWIKTSEVPHDKAKSSPLTEAQLNARLRVRFASRLLEKYRKDQALAQLRKALEGDPENWLIHKQIWAIEHPDRFYEGPVDFAWQRRRLQSEREGESPRD